ncbi:hypothetical protein BP5796_03515 [Coleophoma crateriformis]|uniref:Ubiquitin 3 binding protein But2 C-terminal domain-containing protein n=1 Tax=Coleophoma crateriformis TaxID=565419 RepID=A0A3D8SNS0_9HELO|nr:hypothetical protein BP5796_03515 [Coleophoma crateriformis]
MRSGIYAGAVVLLASTVHAVSGLHERATCSLDNCLRAVGGSAQTQITSAARRDCSSFFVKTVTPCPVTVTSTISRATAVPTGTTMSLTTTSGTETVIITASPAATVVTPNKRDPVAARHADYLASVFNKNVRAVVSTCPATAAPSLVPTYASACSGTARYSSACSCIGATLSTILLAPVTSTVLVTITSTTKLVSTVQSTVTISTTTSTTTTTVAASTSRPVFIIRSEGGIYPGQYLLANGDNSVLSLTTNITAASQFTLDSTGHAFTSSSGYLNIDQGTFQSPLFANTLDEINTNEYPILQCVTAAAAPSPALLSCTASDGPNLPTSQTFETCPEQINSVFFSQSPSFDCASFTLSVVYTS